MQKIAAHPNWGLVMFLFAFCGFGVKAALFPFHSWLPRASVAPTPVTALLHAVAVVKSGAFAIIRVIYYSYGTDFLRGTWAQSVVMLLAQLTMQSMANYIYPNFYGNTAAQSASTLVMLVSALAGREQVLAAYEEAIKERYRFFSFGDAMIVK